MRSGRSTPIAEIPTPALAVPYAAPKHVKMMADAHPMALKKGYCDIVREGRDEGVAIERKALAASQLLKAKRERSQNLRRIPGCEMIMSASSLAILRMCVRLHVGQGAYRAAWS